jgi:hypothetical protein
MSDYREKRIRELNRIIMGLREVERILLTAQRELIVLQGENPELRDAEGSDLCDWINEQLMNMMDEVRKCRDGYMRIKAELEVSGKGD